MKINLGFIGCQSLSKEEAGFRLYSPLRLRVFFRKRVKDAAGADDEKTKKWRSGREYVGRSVDRNGK